MSPAPRSVRWPQIEPAEPAANSPGISCPAGAHDPCQRVPPMAPGRGRDAGVVRIAAIGAVRRERDGARPNNRPRGRRDGSIARVTVDDCSICMQYCAWDASRRASRCALGRIPTRSRRALWGSSPPRGRRPRWRSPPRRGSSPAARLRVQNGIGNEEVIAEHVAARDPRRDASRRSCGCARGDPHGRAGADVGRSVRATAGDARGDRVAGRVIERVRPRDAARARCARRPVDEAAVQRLHEPAVRSDRPDPRRALRQPAHDPPRRRAAPGGAGGGRCARHRARGRPGGARLQRGKGQLRATVRACSRTSRLTARPRSRRSTAASSAPRTRPASVVLLHRAIVDLSRESSELAR